MLDWGTADGVRPGNSPAVSVYGPGEIRWDAAVLKNTNIMKNSIPGSTTAVLPTSRNIVLDTCVGNGNGGYGLNAALASDVVVNATGSFNNNGFGGINAGANSFVALNAWAAPIDISHNLGNGIYASDEAVVGTVGQTTITNNNGPGILMYGNSRAGFGAYYGPNSIQGNAGGGASLNEGAEASFYSFGGGPANLIQSNGAFGVQVGTGAQATSSKRPKSPTMLAPEWTCSRTARLISLARIKS